MSFLVLLVTLLMPKGEVIGVCLQVIAGLIFLVDQVWERILGDGFPQKLKTALDQPSFQHRAPLLIIPIIVPLLLVGYFRFGTSPRPWYEGLFSIAAATTFACFFYLATFTTVESLLRKIKTKVLKKTETNNTEHSVGTNITLLILALIGLTAFMLVLFFVSRLLINSVVPASARYAIISVILASGGFFLYIMLLSIMYFGLLLLLKSLNWLRRIRVGLNDPDKNFIRHMAWVFLLACWVWGGVLIAISLW